MPERQRSASREQRSGSRNKKTSVIEKQAVANCPDLLSLLPDLCFLILPDL
jgi:hypothetical protein